MPDVCDVNKCIYFNSYQYKNCYITRKHVKLIKDYIEIRLITKVVRVTALTS